jgi:hypothetical protein
VGRGLERHQPDGGYFLDLLYGPNKGQANHARFDLPAFNALYERSARCPTAPSASADERAPKRWRGLHALQGQSATASPPTWRSPGGGLRAAPLHARLLGATSTSSEAAPRTMRPAAGAAPCSPARGAGAPPRACTSGAQAPPKVLRYAFRVAETGFDPAKISDLYSRTVTPHIFEALYRYDHLARPARMRRNTAEGMPEVERRLQGLDLPHPARHPLRRRPGLQGPEARAGGADYVYASSASPTRAGRASQPGHDVLEGPSRSA